MHRDRRSLTDDALGPHRSPVRLDEVANDGEAEAGSTFFTCPTSIDPIKALEDSAKVFRRNAAARVANAQRRAAARRRFGAHRDAAARRVANRVLDEVSEDLPERRRVGIDALRVR